MLELYRLRVSRSQSCRDITDRVAAVVNHYDRRNADDLDGVGFSETFLILHLFAFRPQLSLTMPGNDHCSHKRKEG